MEQMAAKRDRSGSVWLIQAFTGLLLAIILGAHMIAHHFIVEGGLRDYQQVLDYVNNPVIFVTEITFVIFATVHALLGIRAIIIDMRPSPGALRAANWALGALGTVAIIYGVYLAVALQRLAG